MLDMRRLLTMIKVMEKNHLSLTVSRDILMRIYGRWGDCDEQNEFDCQMRKAKESGLIELVNREIFNFNMPCWYLTDAGYKFLEEKSDDIEDMKLLLNRIKSIGIASKFEIWSTGLIFDNDLLDKAVLLGLLVKSTIKDENTIESVARNEMRFKVGEFYSLTEFGEGFLNDRIKPFDEFSEMKSFLLSIKEAIEPQHNVFVNSVILGKAFELGLIKSSKGCWTLTEFGREFLIEVEL